MKCLTVHQIYLHLEKELESSENKKIERHLRSCSKCRKALEGRKLLLQAVESLPSWQVPSGFTHQVMDKIFPAKVTLWNSFLALAAGFSTFIAAFFIYILATGQNLSSVFTGFYHNVWEQIKSNSLIFIKFFKLTSISLKILRELLEHILIGFLQATPITSPEVQIFIIFLLILTTSFIFGLQRKSLFGEKQ